MSGEFDHGANLRQPAAGVLHPVLGEVIVIIEVAVVLTIRSASVAARSHQRTSDQRRAVVL
jgi:hypothetical protein